MIPIADVRVRPGPGSLMRAIALRRIGKTRISRRDAELYSIQITCGGTSGRLRITDGDGVDKFYMPSTFTGSFVLACFCANGIIVELEGGIPATLTPNWRERDAKIV